MTEINFNQSAEIPRGEAKINSTRDLMLAISAGHLSEAEAYLMAEKEKPSQSGHDDLWLQNKLAALAKGYLLSGDQASLNRINSLLLENFQVKDRG